MTEKWVPTEYGSGSSASDSYGSDAATSPERRVSELIGVVNNDEACRLLGVEGALEAVLDISFLDDPLDWIAYDIAQAIKSADSDDAEDAEGTIMLTTLVAELRLLRSLKGSIDESGLTRLVARYLEEGD